MRSLSRAISALVVAVLVLASIVATVVGAAHLTVATEGVGAICIGVFVAILARIAQASAHHTDRQHALEDLRPIKP